MKYILLITFVVLFFGNTIFAQSAPIIKRLSSCRWLLSQDSTNENSFTLLPFSVDSIFSKTWNVMRLKEEGEVEIAVQSYSHQTYETTEAFLALPELSWEYEEIDSILTFKAHSIKMPIRAVSSVEGRNSMSVRVDTALLFEYNASFKLTGLDSMELTFELLPRVIQGETKSSKGLSISAGRCSFPATMIEQTPVELMYYWWGAMMADDTLFLSPSFAAEEQAMNCMNYPDRYCIQGGFTFSLIEKGRGGLIKTSREPFSNKIDYAPLSRWYYDIAKNRLQFWYWKESLCLKPLCYLSTAYELIELSKYKLVLRKLY